MQNEPPPPLLSATELSLLRQGLQKLINECADHTNQLYIGQQSVDDEFVEKIESLYDIRKKQCEDLMVKLPLIGNLQNVMSAMLKNKTLAA